MRANGFSPAEIEEFTVFRLPSAGSKISYRAATKLSDFFGNRATGAPFSRNPISGPFSLRHHSPDRSTTRVRKLLACASARRRSALRSRYRAGLTAHPRHDATARKAVLRESPPPASRGNALLPASASTAPAII